MSSATLPSGSDARYATSAALAETEATTATLSSQVEQNATKLHSAAVGAAQSAELKEPQSANAVDRLEDGLSHQTNAAASEGAADVASAKSAANGYVEQAKNLAGSAISTAQSYINSATTQSTQPTDTTNGTTAGGVVQSAIATGKDYLASAQAAAQPYIDSASAAAQPHLEKAKGMVGGTTAIGPSGSDKPSAKPASSAPLESGANIVGNPYPATTNGQATMVGEI
ncbi:hypothetical protein C8Q80DRAFT_58919 [Daedaleopsis nitida]|nr:hypothetical protein C8Q80DRAFT_58919 [Daedaleopsis nitida]